MKIIAVATLMLLASVNALPTLTEDELRQQKIVEGIIKDVINDLSNSIKERGLDPVYIDHRETSFALSEPEIFSVYAMVEELDFKGLSDISVNSINFSILQTRLTFDISLPSVALRVGASGFEIYSFGSVFTGSASGSLEIIQIRLVGDVRVSVGIISGISIRNLSLTFSLGGIESNLDISLFNRDLSESVNNFLNKTLPSIIAENGATINELLEELAWIIIDRIL